MHIKLVKIYFKSSNYTKALKHIFKLDYKSMFNEDPAQSWHTSTIDLIETTLSNQEALNIKNETEINFLYLTLLNLVKNQLLNSLKINDVSNISNLFLK